MSDERPDSESAKADPGPGLRFVGVTKRYGPTTVLRDVDLALAPGQIHSLVGANGAGKSTLVGIVSGKVDPTAGEVYVFGEVLKTASPRASRDAGIATVFQELTIVPQLSALANVFLGGEHTRGGFLRQREMKSRYEELCRQFGVTLKPSTPAGQLSVADLQLLEIMRAIEQDARILILDEPTAALSVTERDLLFELMRSFTAAGRTIVIISHSLGDVLAISDTVSVMRNGTLIDSGPTRQWSHDSLIHAMMGDVASETTSTERPERGPVLLEVKSVTQPGVLSDVGLSVRQGEIVGLAGLVGAGRTSVLRALAGAEPAARGELYLRGVRRPWPKTVRRSLLRYGIALLPEERKTQGLLLHLDVGDNATIARLSGAKRGPFVHRPLQRRIAAGFLEALHFNRAVGTYRVDELSGGNQQKVALAKWLHRDPDVLLADEPTRGVDIKAKREVMEALRTFAARGKGVIMTSSELDEVLDVSDRVLVLHQGRVVADLDLHETHPTEREVLALCFGVSA